VVKTLGAACGVLWRLGWRGAALTPDKARELLARHWTAKTRESLAVLGVDRWVEFSDGAAETWSWYRRHGWLG
jgi:hypothetical protein